MTTARRPRRFWRRLLWCAAALVVGRLLLALLLPWLLGLAAGAGGLALDYRAAQLSLMGLSLRLDDVTLRDADAPNAATPPLLTAEEVVVDCAAWQLLRGQFTVVDVVLAGARVHLAQDADGTVRLPAAWRADGAAAPAPAAADATPPQPLRFEAPLQVASLRVHDLRLELVDATGAVAAQAAFDLELRDFGRDDRPAELRARVTAPGTLDRAELQATLALRGDDAAARWHLSLRGLRPGALPWLDDPRHPSAPRTIGGDLTGDAHARVDGTAAWPIVRADVQLDTTVDERELLRAELTAGPSHHAAGAFTLPLAATVRGTDLVESLRLTDAQLVLRGERAASDGSLAVAKLTLRRLAPWLASLGVTMPEHGLDLAAHWHVQHDAGRVRAALRDVTGGSADRQFVLPRVELTDLQVVGESLRVAALEVEGPRLAVTRRPGGDLEVLGVGFGPPPPSATTTAPLGAATPARFVWPRLAVDRLQWTGAELEFVDASLPSEPALVTRVEVSGERLAMGQDAANGTLRAEVTVPGSLASLRADVDLTPTADALAAACRLQANGITLGSLAPWLQPAGLTPQLRDGRLRAGCAATARADAGALHLTTHVADVRFEDGDDVWLGLRRIDGTGVVLGPQPDLGSWTVDEPYAVVHRDTDGTLRALGMRIAAASAPAAPANAPATRSDATATTPAPTTGAAVAHGTIELRRAVLRWIDADRTDPADLAVGLDLRLAPEDAPAGTATTFAATLRLDPAIGTLGLRGAFAPGPDGGRIDAELTGEHLRGQGLQPVLPDGVTCTLEGGTLRARLAAAWQARAGAATGLDVQLQDVALLDRGTELLAVDSFRVTVPELSAESVHVALVQATGVRAVAASTPAGLQLPGVQLAPAAATAAAPPAAVEATSTPAAAPLRLPALRLDAIDLAVERVEWRQRGATDGEPLVATARLALAEPWATASDVERTPPCRLVLQASAAPLCRQVLVDVELAPFALAPTVQARVHASGIDTTALAAVQPNLAAVVTGTRTDAEFTTSLHGRLDLRRRDPQRFDLGHPFGGELVFEQTMLRAGAEQLLHIDEVACELRAFDPQRGDVLLRSVEIAAPRLAVANGPGGLECLGLRFAPPPTDAAPAAAEPPPPAAGAPANAPEVAVDRLQVLGLELTFRDPSTTPPTELPLRDCDLKVLNLSTRALAEARPIAFTAALHGGDVTLERRVRRSSALAGLLGSAAEALAGNADRFEPERRPLVDEVAVSGQVQLWPQAKGQMRTVVHGLELPALRGLAKTGGVDLADGVFDFTLDARLEGAQGIELSMRPKFTWLSLTEPPGGPISTYLKLPAPLDTVLFALRNDDDEHVLPLSLQVPAAGLSGAAVTAAATETLARLIADAVASAAFRVGGMVTGAVGLGGEADLSNLTATLAFAPGDPLPTDGSLSALLVAAADDPGLVVVLAHELGRGDLERAAELACPPAAVVTATVQRLQAEHDALAGQRADLAGRTAALFAAGRMQDAWQAHHELHAVDGRLGALVLTLEQALRMSLGESERAVRRRTRAGAVALAEARLAAVRQQVATEFGPALAQRIEWRTPRGIEIAGLPAGGRVVATLRRRAAH